MEPLCYFEKAPRVQLVNLPGSSTVCYYLFSKRMVRSAVLEPWSEPSFFPTSSKKSHSGFTVHNTAPLSRNKSIFIRDTFLNDLFLFYFVNPFLWCATVFLNLLKQFLSVTLLKLFYLLQNSGLWGQQHKRANSSPPGDMSFNSSKSSLGSPLIHHSDHQSPDIRPNLQLSLINRDSNFKGIVSQDFEWLRMILMNRLYVPDVLLEVYSFLNHYFFV